MQRLEAYFPKNVAEIMLDSLTQWDKDVLLHISGDELPEAFEIHMGYEGIFEALVFPVQKKNGVATVKIPNELLQQTMNIKAWTYLIDAEGCRTTKTIIIPVAKREKPADFNFSAEPSQKDAVEQLVERTNELISTSADLQEMTAALQEQNEKVLENLDQFNVTVDQSFNAESSNAQSGKAVAEAINGVNNDNELKHLRDAYCKQACAAKRVTTFERTQAVLNDAKYASVAGVGGKSLYFEQMINSANIFSGSKTEQGITFTNNGDGSITANGTATGSNARVFLYPYKDSYSIYPVIQGHKYLLCGCPSESGCFISWGLAGDDSGSGRISTATSTTNIYVYCKVNNGATVTNAIIKPQMFDLTAIFGSGNEPKSLEEFRAVFPLSYYQYNASLVNAHISSIDALNADGEAVKSIEIPSQLSADYPLHSTNDIYDEYSLDTMKYIKRVGVRAYESGDENNTAVLTDGVTTHYPLVEPTFVDISAYFTDVDLITEVEVGGAFVFNQENYTQLQMPVSVNYFLPTITNQKQEITVGCHNAADFGITGEGYTDEQMATYIPQWKKLITKWFNTADFLVFIEWYPYLDKNQSVSAYETLFKQFYPYYYLEPAKQNKAILSKYPCEVEQFKDGANTVTGFDCIKAVTNIGGKSVAVITWLTGYATGDGSDPVIYRKNVYQKAIKYLQEYDAVIVAGDFNNSNAEVGTSELSVWTDAGYVLGNGGYWGDIVTCPSNINHGECGAIDNIITKGFSFNDFTVGEEADSVTSDHRPIKANLTLFFNVADTGN